MQSVTLSRPNWLISFVSGTAAKVQDSECLRKGGFFKKV